MRIINIKTAQSPLENRWIVICEEFPEVFGVASTEESAIEDLYLSIDEWEQQEKENA